jgi:hypothetical protein
MPKRKPQPEGFDVVEFLRESDDDLKSALNSLLRPSVEEISNKLSPTINLLPTPKLADSPIKLISPSNLIGATNVGSAQNSPKPEAGVIIEAGLNLVEPLRQRPATRHFAIREMRQAQDAHTRAEQHVYECLWANATSYDEISRSITIGFGAMARLVALSESNARINLRSLIAKLAVEEIAEYNCERSVGRTYRIFDAAEILRRRREAGLRWFMRRTLAVVFVDPATGQPLLKKKGREQLS